MSLQGGRDLLSGAAKTLLGHWDHTAPHWQDAASAEFVEHVLTPLQDYLAAALRAVDRMNVILQQMRRDCDGSPYDILGVS
jgi:hypothetical protein